MVNGSDQYYSRCVRRDADHGCDEMFIMDPTGNTSSVIVSLYHIVGNF